MRLNANTVAEQPEAYGPEPELMSAYMYVDDIQAMETERKNKEAAKEAAQRPAVIPGKTLVLSMMDKPAGWYQMSQSDRFRLKKDFLIQLCGASNVWFEEDGLPRKSQDILAFRFDYFAAFEVADDPVATQAFKDTYMLTTRLCNNNSIAHKDLMNREKFDELVSAIYRRDQAYRAWAAGKRREAACRAKSYKLPAAAAPRTPAYKLPDAAKSYQLPAAGKSYKLPAAAAPRTPAAPPAPIPVSRSSAIPLTSTYVSRSDASSGKRKAAVMSTGQGQDNGPAPKKQRTMAPNRDTTKNYPNPSIATRPSAVTQPQARSYVESFNRGTNKNYQQPFITPRPPAFTQPQATPRPSAGPPTASLQNQITNRFISHLQQTRMTPPPPQKVVNQAHLHSQSVKPGNGQPGVQQQQQQQQQRQQQQQQRGRIGDQFGQIQQARLMHAHYASVVERYHGLLQLIIRSRRLDNGNQKEPGDVATSLRDIARLLGFEGWAINLAATPEANMYDLARRHFSRHLDLGMQVLEVDRVAASVAGVLSQQLAAHNQQY